MDTVSVCSNGRVNEKQQICSEIPSVAHNGEVWSPAPILNMAHCDDYRLVHHASHKNCTGFVCLILVSDIIDSTMNLLINQNPHSVRHTCLKTVQMCLLDAVKMMMNQDQFNGTDLGQVFTYMLLLVFLQPLGHQLGTQPSLKKMMIKEQACFSWAVRSSIPR